MHTETRIRERRIDIVLDDNHQGHVRRKHDTPNDRSHDRDDERNDGDGMGVQEQGENKDDGREPRCDEMEREEEQQTRLSHGCELCRESDTTEETRRNRVTELRTVACALRYGRV